MFTVKKYLKIKEHIVFPLVIAYFCLCCYALRNLDIYTVCPVTESDSAPTIDVISSPPEKNGNTEEELAPLITDTRTLKSYRGAIGIFDCFGSLLGSYDIRVALLPYEDRKSLDEGIVFANENEMRDFLASLDS